MTNSYSERFQSATDVADYESKEYAAESYSSFIWKLQRPLVENIVQTFSQSRPSPVRLLDFACGTGRVISALETLVTEATGVDISENMVALARQKCRKTQFRVGDILSEPALLDNGYDLITSFRFLLNVEPELRRRALKKLRTVIQPDGLLVVNVHGSSRSLRHPAIVWRRWRERTNPTNAMLNEMSPAETRALLTECGFRIERQLGFGQMPPTLFRTPLRAATTAIDKWMAGDNLFRHTAIDVLYVCRPI